MAREQIGPELLLGELVEDCNIRSLRDWLKQYKGARSSEEMVTTRLFRREINVSRNERNGSIKVTCTLIGRLATPSEVYFYDYDRVRENAWREVIHTRYSPSVR